MSQPGHPMYEAARWRFARLVRAPGAELAVWRAFDDYDTWARARGRVLVGARQFRNAMKAAGYVERLGGDGGNVFADCALKQVTEGVTEQ